MHFTGSYELYQPTGHDRNHYASVFRLLPEDPGVGEDPNIGEEQRFGGGAPIPGEVMDGFKSHVDAALRGMV